MTRSLQAWEQQPDESTPAFHAFATYRDLHEERSTAAVARELRKSKTLMDRWSSAHSWVERCRLWDLYTDNLLREQNIRQRREMMKRISMQR
jgi:hypothetical protein